jgi:hypothetical protein
MTETSPTLDELANAAGKFLDEIAEKARRNQPAVHAEIDALLKSGESYTNVNIKVFESGIQIRATINKISDDEEQAVLDQVDGVVRLQQ